MVKKLSLLFLSSVIFISANSQCNFGAESSFLKFSGIAPAPWAIDGNTTDWQIAFTYPYNKSLELNDLDHPAPAGNINLSAHTYDSKNVYFYLHRLANTEPNPSYYFFIDLNFDGHMNTGEPVFGGRFNGRSPISVFSYQVDAATNVAGKGNVMYDNLGNTDGFSMKGTTLRVFNSNQVPAAYALTAGEKFEAAVTEDGAGVELAIPWKFFRDWSTNSSPLVPGNTFAYHLALQAGPANANFTYNMSQVTDNMSNCCKKLNFLPAPTPDYSFSSSRSGLTINATFSSQNVTNQSINAGVFSVSFTNLAGLGAGTFDPSYISVSINNQPLIFDNDEFLLQGTIAYHKILSPITGNSTQVDNIVIQIPANSPVTGYRVQINPAISRYIAPFVNCDQTPLGGGGGGGPIILDVTTENRNRINLGNENSGNTVSSLNVYPNPSKGSITVDLPANAKGIVRVEDLSGKIVQQVPVNGSKLNLHNLRAGFYMVRFISGSDNRQYVSKLVVE